MKKVYYYNENAKTLHISGCCKSSKSGLGGHVRYFDTENQVLAHAGLSFKWCEECLCWREKVILDAWKKQEEQIK